MIDDELLILDTKTENKNKNPTMSVAEDDSVELQAYDQPASDTVSHSSLDNFSEHEDNFEKVALP